MRTALVQFLDFIDHNRVGSKQKRMKSIKRSREKNLQGLPAAGVDVLFSHDLTFLKNTEFYQEYSHMFKHHRLCGYACWKPYVILDAMKQMDDGDVVFYYDCNYVDFSEIIHGSRQTLSQFTEMTKEIGHVFHATEYQERQCTKRDAFILMDCDKPCFYQTPQVQSTWCSLLNNEKNREFVQLWLDYSKDERIITDQANCLNEKNRPGFIAHRHDQSVMSLMVKKFNYNYYIHPNKNIWHFLWAFNKNKINLYE
jgi:hypothetical protein